jgi:DNA-binding CsgD family transcriptional regulator
VRWRSRRIAYNQWQPWADADAVRRHVRRLRAAGFSYQAIASAAGVSPMTVHRHSHAGRHPSHRARGSRPVPGRIRAGAARRLLAVTPATVEQAAPRRDATGTRRRLQALIAVGYPTAWLAHRLDVTPRTITGIISGTTATVTPGLHTAVTGLYNHLWDTCPPEDTAAERNAAAAARALAAHRGWPTPMGLDDDRIDDPAYRPRTHWKPTVGAAVTSQRHPRSSTRSRSRRRLSTDTSGGAAGPRIGCQAANPRPLPGAHR